MPCEKKGDSNLGVKWKKKSYTMIFQTIFKKCILITLLDSLGVVDLLIIFVKPTS